MRVLVGMIVLLLSLLLLGCLYLHFQVGELKEDVIYLKEESEGMKRFINLRSTELTQPRKCQCSK